MDLSTIKSKLEGGEYTDPWGFIDDMWLMFENAWLFNRKNTRVYKMCTALSKEFLSVGDPVMKDAGLCCAKKLNFTALPLCCYGKATCTITVGGVYFVHKTSASKLGVDTPEKIYYCEKCFNDAKGNEVAGPDGQQKIPKEKFHKKRNDEKDPEPFLTCAECAVKNHEICVLYKKDIYKEAFVCDRCLNKNGKKRKDNKFTAKYLPECTLRYSSE